MTSKQDNQAEELQPGVKLPKCQAEVGFEARKYRQSWARRHNESYSPQCRNLARYKINGKNYCGRHAEVVALYILLGKSKPNFDPH